MAESWWYQQCEDNIKKIPGAVMCSPEVCANQPTSHLIHLVCNCLPPYLNGCTEPRQPGCCAYGPASPIPIFSPAGLCYCCCANVGAMAMAVDRTTFKPINEFAVGDKVLVATKPDLSAWEQAPVAFSSGTGPGSDSPTIQVRYGDPSQPETLIVAARQLFLLAGGKLKQASRLVAGQDQLVRADGSAAPIIDVLGGIAADTLHRIATSTEPATSLAGHLMVANGVVCGDYALQLGNLEQTAPDLLVAGHADLPELGSAAYARSFAKH